MEMERLRFPPPRVWSSLCFLGCLLFNSFSVCTMNPNREEVLSTCFTVVGQRFVIYSF
jgi:hypothetical protein